ncbi:MAG: hemerythrin family protein [Bdellovibrionales bacterium]|nr:hemerythrin family protein [Bdellovibrionales bacterium]
MITIIKDRIEWDHSLFSVGIEKIDDQHKVLVQLINSIQLKKNSKDKDFIEKIVNTLVVYVEKHFHDEEQIMQNMGFPGLGKHKEKHGKFDQIAREFAQKFSQPGDQAVVLEQLVAYLKKWLISHILVEDKAYKDYLFRKLD